MACSHSKDQEIGKEGGRSPPWLSWLPSYSTQTHGVLLPTFMSGRSPSAASLWEDFRRHTHRYDATSLMLTLAKLTVKIDSHRASVWPPMAEDPAGSRDSGIAQP